MAAIIDGTTYKGYWKLTADDASPLVYFLYPKDEVYLTTTDGTSGTLRSGGSGIIGFDATCEDENGNALNTVAKVSQYLSDNR